MPLVTIIIPVYNTEKYLRQCLDSVVNQTYRHIEIIIINDCSPDNSKEIIETYAKNHQNIKVINNPINLGLSEARNIGLNIAQGDYIYFVDSDDWIELNTIEKMVDLAQWYNVSLVEAKHKMVFTSKEPIVNNQIQTIKRENLEREKEKIITRPGNVWNKLYDHDLIGDLRFPIGLEYEDVAFIFPLLTKVKNTVITDAIFYFYRRHFNSITIRNKLKPNYKILDLYDILDCIKGNCIQIGTYEEYQSAILEVIKNKAFAPILECNSWMQIKRHDKELLLASLYQYSKEKYHMDALENMPLIQERMKNDKLYRLRLNILKQHLNNVADEIASIDSLEPARRIISKYKK